MTGFAGLLLAGGAGRRFGRPKALVEYAGEALVTRAARILADGGCSPVLAVLGAEAAAARELLPDTVTAVVAPDWEQGMGATLRAGLAAIDGVRPRPDAVMVHLVDLPDVGADVVARLGAVADVDAVARACYQGVPGHPVVIGNRWWADVASGLRGDAGARGWLAGRDDVLMVECADLAGGGDVDTVSDLPS